MRYLRAAERLPAAPLPLDFQVQSVAASDVAKRLRDLLASEPTGGLVQFGGPEVLTVEQMAETWRSARGGRPRVLWRLPLPGEVAAGLRKGLNTCPEEALGAQRWSEFVATSGRRDA